MRKRETVLIKAIAPIKFDGRVWRPGRVLAVDFSLAEHLCAINKAEVCEIYIGERQAR